MFGPCEGDPGGARPCAGDVPRLRHRRKGRLFFRDFVRLLRPAPAGGVWGRVPGWWEWASRVCEGRGRGSGRVPVAPRWLVPRWLAPRSLWHARVMEFPGFRRAERSHFERDVLEMAPLLLGSLLVHQRGGDQVCEGAEIPTEIGNSLGGAEPAGGADAAGGARPAGGGDLVVVRLTEVEAYAGARDPGSHSFRGRTERNATMFGPPGHLYCYFTYGMHHALNIVCDDPGIATGCLLRAGEVTHGRKVARRRRESPPGKVRRERIAPLRDEALARGPGNLAAVFAATRAATDGADLCEAAGAWQLWVPETPPDPASIRSGPRVGVAGEGGDGARYPWRFWLEGERTVSSYRAAADRTRRGCAPGLG